MPDLSEDELTTLADCVLRKAKAGRSVLMQLGLAALVAGGVGSGSGIVTGTLSKAEAQQLAQTEARAEVARSDRIAKIEAEVEKQADADDAQQKQLDAIQEDVKLIDRNLRAMMNYQRGRDSRAPKPEAPERAQRDDP